jgi:hypothetical protein
VPPPTGPANQHSIDDKEQDRAHYRCNKSRSLACLIPPDRSPEKSGECGSSKPNKHGYDDTARITAGHEQLGERAYDQTYD